MTAAMRAMGELDAQDQGEVLRCMARLRSKRDVLDVLTSSFTCRGIARLAEH
jgi:hypothetical protein